MDKHGRIYDINNVYVKNALNGCAVK